ncbi:MAG TPA: aspartate 1-decarboxylase [bacterium (Candidatus Stahlbacteria)]|nr:aspartate 1-decarboxylase [Candidatus Stahlbacteria bacterium]
MYLKFLKAKINKVKITGKNLFYEGSITLPPTVIKTADLKPGEAVLCVNLSNGSRFETYLIEGEKDGEVLLNGGAARLGEIGDELLLLCFVYLEPDEVDYHKPKILYLDDRNRPRRR